MSEDCHDSDNYEEEPGFFVREQEKKQRAGEYGPNPYAHVYRPASMDGCLSGCRACEWEKEQRFAARERLGYPPSTMQLSDYDKGLLNGMHVKWDGDSRQ